MKTKRLVDKNDKEGNLSSRNFTQNPICLHSMFWHRLCDYSLADNTGFGDGR